MSQAGFALLNARDINGLALAHFLASALESGCSIEPSGLPRLQAVTQLSRAVKEHERREGEKIGFSDSPADCLAYQYFRDVRPLSHNPNPQSSQPASRSFERGRGPRVASAWRRTSASVEARA